MHDRNITQGMIALRACTSVPQINRICKGRTKITPYIIEQFKKSKIDLNKIMEE